MIYDDDNDEVGLRAKSKINQGTGSGDERRSDCSSSQFNKTPFLNLQLSVFTIFMTMMVLKDHCVLAIRPPKHEGSASKIFKELQKCA